MKLQQATPGTELDRWIHSFRHYTFTPGDSPQFTCLPGTGAELWMLCSGQLSHTWCRQGNGLLCLRSQRLEFQQSGLQVFAIRFRAGALPFFTDQSQATLIDRYTPITMIWNDSVLQSMNQLQRSQSFEEQCLLARCFLLSLLRAGRHLEPMQTLATVIYEHSSDFVLSTYAGQLQRDRSHLSRQFHDIQGTSAKHFHRLCRFERFLRDALFSAESSLAGLAVDHGYYDQAHMHHEVRQLSRLSPRLLLARDESRLFYSPRTALSQGTQRGSGLSFN